MTERDVNKTSTSAEFQNNLKFEHLICSSCCLTTKMTTPTLLAALRNVKLFLDENYLFFFKGPTTALISTPRDRGSSKGLNKPSLDTLFSNTWLLVEKSGK